MIATTTVLDRLHAKDELTFNMGDALDTKASIALVVITFFATQTAWFVGEHHVAGFWLVVQTLSAVLLVLAGVFAIAALWPRRYYMEGAENLDSWLGQLERHYANRPGADGLIQAQMAVEEIRLAKERIATNTKRNALKADLISWSFWCSSAAFSANLATVIALTIPRLS